MPKKSRGWSDGTKATMYTKDFLDFVSSFSQYPLFQSKPWPTFPDRISSRAILTRDGYLEKSSRWNAGPSRAFVVMIRLISFMSSSNSCSQQNVISPFTPDGIHSFNFGTLIVSSFHTQPLSITSSLSRASQTSMLFCTRDNCISSCWLPTATLLCP